MTRVHVRWTSPEAVAGFAASPPNEVLMRFASAVRHRARAGTLLDIGCGAGRNAIPLARDGWRVIGTDLSWPMISAAAARAREEGVASRLACVHAPMETLPVADASVDLVVAHGIWNLAESAAQFRRAVADAARVTKPGGALFVFTFSRHTLPSAATPIEGEPFVYTQFNGTPQVFLTAAQLAAEMAAAGFEPDPAVPLTEYNRPSGLIRPTGPVIYEAAFTRRYAPAS
jgi:ubiquinone/menaquinone biosynthesis C-methylase UbiE